MSRALAARFVRFLGGASGVPEEELSFLRKKSPSLSLKPSARCDALCRLEDCAGGLFELGRGRLRASY